MNLWATACWVVLHQVPAAQLQRVSLTHSAAQACTDETLCTAQLGRKGDVQAIVCEAVLH